MISRLAVAAAVIIYFAVFFNPVEAAVLIATQDDARTVAENWIAALVTATGGWGDSPSASVGEIEELTRGKRLLGYWCHVEPHGHIVVSLSKALSPVKAVSETWDGDPTCDTDIIDVIKYKIEKEHDFIEARVGPIETAAASDIEVLLESRCREEWILLSGSPEEFHSKLASNQAIVDYREGTVLLSTEWHQAHPYNLYMPSNTTDCTESFDFRCATGCVSLAAAQIMKYWNWPPYGIGSPYDDYYDWTDIPDKLTPDSPEQEITATAELISEVGQACQTKYCNHGCGSSSLIDDIYLAYLSIFRFDIMAVLMEHIGFTSDAWFSHIQNSININSPLHYRIPDHQIVCDGWRIVSGINQYHMNYGWGGAIIEGECWEPYADTGSNTWFTIDLLPCNDLSEEILIAFLRPSVSLNNELSGTYSPNASFPWLYINMDTSGENAAFMMGHMIQSLPGMTVGCTSSTGGAIRFYGGEEHHTRIFARGDWTKGVKITDGGIALYGPASMIIY